MGREGEEQIKAPLVISSITHDEDGYGKVTEEIKKQLWLAGPLICVSLLQYSLQLISIMFVGHLGELSLSGASMATSFATITGFSLFEDDKHKAHCKVKECFSIEERDGNVTISIGPEGERKPFMHGKKDGGFGNASKDLSNL